MWADRVWRDGCVLCTPDKNEERFEFHPGRGVTGFSFRQARTAEDAEGSDAKPAGEYSRALSSLNLSLDRTFARGLPITLLCGASA